MSWLKNSSKKFFKGVAIIVAGTFILSGVALAASKQDNAGRYENRGDNRPAYHQKEVDPAKVAQMVSKTFGVSQEKVAAYQAQGYEPRDLFRAGLFAKAAGKSYDQVISLKTKDNTWKDVGEKLGVTKEQLAEARQDLFAQRAAQALKMDKSAVKALLQQGHKSRDIIPAGVLANRTGKSIGEVLSLKKDDNKWMEVAASLGVSEENFRNDMRALFKDTGMGEPGQKKSKKRHNFDKKIS